MEKKFELVEMFYSLQGEGEHHGRAAVFIRLSRCDMHCHFCDTPYNEVNQNLTALEIRRTIAKLIGEAGTKELPMIVLTGGEPALQLLDEEASTQLSVGLAGFYVAIETTGMHPIPEWIDWVTVSPKVWPVNIAIDRVSELKFLMYDTGEFSCGDKEAILKELPHSPCFKLFVQPITDIRGHDDKTRAAEQIVMEFIKANPRFIYGNRLQNQIGVR